jgi:hypothetical protein
VTGNGQIFVVPTSVAVSPSTEFTININQKADFTTTGTYVTIEFDKNLLQIESVDRAPAFSRQGAAFVAGVVKLDASGMPAGQQTLVEAIADANQNTGSLRDVSRITRLARITSTPARTRSSS